MGSLMRQCAAAMLLLGAAAGARAEIYLVVASGSPVYSLSRKEAINLYTGRTRSLSDGQAMQALDLPRDHALRGEMYRLLTGLTLAQINSYWSRLTFTGQTRALPTAEAEAQMVEQLRANPLALGYLAHEPRDGTLRVVLVLKE